MDSVKKKFNNNVFLVKGLTPKTNRLVSKSKIARRFVQEVRSEFLDENIIICIRRTRALSLLMENI